MWVTPGSTICTSSLVPGPTLSTQVAFDSDDSANAAASYTLSAVTSTL